MTKPGYTLQELIDKCDESAPVNDELEEWEQAIPTGEELDNDDKKAECVDLIEAPSKKKN